jgi:hypothetical protein
MTKSTCACLLFMALLMAAALPSIADGAPAAAAAAASVDAASGSHKVTHGIASVCAALFLAMAV